MKNLSASYTVALGGSLLFSLSASAVTITGTETTQPILTSGDDLIITAGGSIDTGGAFSPAVGFNSVTYGLFDNAGSIISSETNFIQGAVDFQNATLSNGFTNTGSIFSTSTNAADPATAVTLNNSTITNGFTNTGSMNGKAASLYLTTSSAIEGGLINSGTMTAEFAFGAEVGIGLDNNSYINGGIDNSGLIEGLELSSAAHISGGINNTGSIATEGPGKWAISLSAATIDGGITNNGTGVISATDGGGIVLFSSGASITGDISNASGAAIIATAGYDGIRLESDVSLIGSILNDGSISGGFGGIDTRVNSIITGDIINTGVVSGEFSGITLGGALSGNIENSGTIESTDTFSSDGVNISGTVSGSLINQLSGQIEGVGVLGGTVTNGIVNAGDIIVDVNSFAIAIQNGGTISSGINNTGTISGLDGINAYDDSTISGDIVNAGLIEGVGRHGIELGESSFSAASGLSMTGNIINSSSGVIDGLNTGLSINNVSMLDGSVDNSGQISGGNTGLNISNSAAINGDISNTGGINGGSIGIHVNNSGVVNGDISNIGVITGQDAGISLFNAATVTGDIINNNSITATGLSSPNGASGIAISIGSTIDGNIVNNSLSTISGSQRGIILAGNGSTATVNGAINNAGTIEATSTDSSVAIALFDNALLGQGLVNQSTGVISGHNYAALVGQSSTLNGGITNAGTMIATNSNVDDGTGSSGILLFDNGSVTGGLLNSGSILSSGPAVLLVGNSSLTGDLVNTGTIEGSAGIEVNGSSIDGDIINSGTITATTEDYAGIDIFTELNQAQDAAVPATMTGGIINSGLIENTATLLDDGDPAPAIWLDGIDLQGGIVNEANGIIRSAASEAIVIDNIDSLQGIAIPRTVVRGISNDGVIESSNGLESAISLYGGQITGGVFNNSSGVISGAQALRITGITSDETEDFDNDIETESIKQDTTSGITGGISNSGQLLGTIDANLVSSASIPLFSNNAVDYGTVSISHGASVDFISNSGLIQNTGAAPALSIGSNNDIANLPPGGDPQDIVLGLPLAVVEPGSITGNLENSGNIIADNNAAIFLNNGAINGSILNNSNATIDGSGGGIIAFNSAIAGDIINAGDIISAGPEGPALNNGYGIDIQLSSVGAITNSGTITGGFILEDSSMSGFFTNEGLLQAAANGGDAFVVRGSSSINQLSNNGSLIGDGAIVVEAGAQLNALFNSGNISGTDVAIAAVDSGSTINLIFNGEGATITGGTQGAIVAANGGSIAEVDNLGTIIGDTVVTADGDINSDVGNVYNEGTMGNVSGADYVYNEGVMGNVSLNGGIYNSTGGTSGTVTGAGIFFLATTGSEGLAPTAETVSRINGDFTFDGSLFLYGIVSTDAGFTETARLDVTGDVDVRGASVIIETTFDSVMAVGDDFSILSAGGSLNSDISTASGVTYDYDNTDAEASGIDPVTGLYVEDTSLVLDYTIEQRGNQLFAVVGSNDVNDAIAEIYVEIEDEELDVFIDTTGGSNVLNTAEALTDISDSGDIAEGSELDQALQALQQDFGEGDEVALVKAVDSLSPETVEAVAVSVMNADSVAASTVNNRSTALRGYYGFSGAMAGDPMGINGFWMQAYDNETDQNTRDGIDGFDADTYGFALGFDSALGEQVNAGLAFSYADTDVEGKIKSSEMSIDSYRLALYGSYNADSYYLDGQIAYAFNEYETDRQIDPSLTNSPLVASGDHDGDQYSLRFRAGYPYATENGWFITPKAELDYTYLSEDDYRETGAGNVGLEVTSDDVEVLILGIGVKFAYPISTANEITWIPEFSVDYLYDTIGDEVEIDSNFIGVSGGGFITRGANVEQEMYKASLRLRAFGQGAFSFSGGYDYIEKDEYDSHSIMATLRYDF
ncbi:autotransporter domain-containing protein [Oceanicoccus sagamiensis]|uniref:Autotransporter domain-containing protein n=1 Tax=Oceanicoccus sagamiensis TaxID=716816 RepID=A0A1X9NDW2_9GAMM|nr:autotransporter domain-containing protein [Oceanicoccus sagamiensis]ARN75746.1 hypothetical protein BST96_17515 [Oceanicoccus sagamiensis]